MSVMRTVLVPIAPQEEGDLMCRFLSGMGANGTGHAVLANVVDPTGLESPVVASMLDMARDRLRAMSGPLADCGIHTEFRVSTGEPVDALAHLASRGEFTGVVMGTHGRLEWSKVFRGSISSELLSVIRIPMMLVRFDLLRNVEDPAAVARSFARTVVVACDFSAASTRAVLALLEMGAKRSGSVFLVHVLSPSLEGTEKAKAEAGATFQLNNYVAMLRKAGIDAHPVIRQGESSRELLDEIEDRRATGAVMGARGRTVVEAAVLGSKSAAVVSQAPCPVIVVP